MTSLLFSLLSFILVFAIIVFVHEFGHFWVARRMGVRVLRFSIGFGPIIWSKTDKYGTQFAVSAIPLGGYVKMLDGREQTLQEDEKPFAFDHKPVGKRIAVVAAGPAFNFIFAIVAFACVLMVGVEKMVPLIAHVQADSPAAKAGIQTGDELVSIAGTPTPDWQTVYLVLLQHAGEQGDMAVTVRQYPDKPLRNYALPIPTLDKPQKNAQPDPLNQWGVTLGLPHIPAVLGEIVPDGPAAHAGLQTGDKVLAVDNHPVHDWYDLVDYVRARPQQPIEFTLEHANQTFNKTVTPREETVQGELIGVIGVRLTPEPLPEGFTRLQRENPLSAFSKAVVNTWDLSILTFNIMGKMLTGLIGLENLAGPIAIAEGAHASVSSGWMAFVSFLILISVNLGVINLLPIPMLDGGHLLYYVLELIRGKPLPEAAQRTGLIVGFVLVIGLMLVGLHNDIMNFR